MAALLLAAGCGGGETPERDAPRPVAVRVVSPSVETLRREASYVGEVGSAREVTVVARIAGTIERLPKVEGERVGRGDLVAVLGAPEQGARLQRAAAELARARQESDLACEQHETNEQLHSRGALASVQLDQSRTRCETSSQAVNASRSVLQEARVVGHRRREHAQVDGRVLAWHAQPGEHVAPGQPILQIGSDAREVRVRIVEPDLRRGIGVGTNARLVMVDGSELRAPVTELSPASHGPAHTLEVTLGLGAGPEVRHLPHGSSVDVAFVLAEAPEALTLPVEALHRDGDDRFVYVVDDRVARRRAVRVLVRAEGRVAVEGAVGPEDAVIVGEPAGLSDGGAVYPVSEDAP